jgi:hypothetical protein
LNIAIYHDYLAGLECAIMQSSFGAALCLWQSIITIPEEEDLSTLTTLPEVVRNFYERQQTQGKHRSLDDLEQRLLCMVLEAENETWTLQLARQSPEWFLNTLDHVSTILSETHFAHVNLMHLVRCHHSVRIFPDGARLLAHTLYITCSFADDHPWQGVSVYIRELLRTESALPFTNDSSLLPICQAIDRCPDGTEERETLYMLLEYWRDKLDSDMLLNVCCEHTTTGVPMGLLLDYFAVEDTMNYDYVASRVGTMDTLEVCLDHRKKILDTTRSDTLLLHMADNCHTYTSSRSLAHILENILVCASNEGVQSALNIVRKYGGYTDYSAHTMRNILMEHLARQEGWSVDILYRFDCASFSWLLQRNPGLTTTLPPEMDEPHATWARTFLTQQASIRANILANTSLADDAIGLVMMYA